MLPSFQSFGSFRSCSDWLITLMKGKGAPGGRCLQERAARGTTPPPPVAMVTTRNSVTSLGRWHCHRSRHTRWYIRLSKDEWIHSIQVMLSGNLLMLLTMLLTSLTSSDMKYHLDWPRLYICMVSFYKNNGWNDTGSVSATRPCLLWPPLPGLLGTRKRKRKILAANLVTSIVACLLQGKIIFSFIW